MPHILAVDDDPEVLGTIERVLQRENYQVTPVNSGKKALQFLENNHPDMMILDIIMPEMDGITVCSTVRRDARYTALPILFLTAKGSTDDIVDGLDAGADDYVVKPFELAELRARVHALLRRGARERESEAVMRLGNLKLDSDTYQVQVGDEAIQLTSTEHRLLRYFMEHIDQALSLSHLLQAVWEYPSDAGDPDLVRAHVRNLRAKIEKDPSRKYIRTIHGVGYMMSS
ncbi:MAG: response regulator transcription factor [bacterium]|jgi:DNA-binding response OmpR family regulator|nr:response regulator transcription factor [bacterium]